ncbi:hypothetical protein C8R44DRAFT_32647 [Mycena epipterygia]|nr:hypothetical protein C8R44DRAFT_32647 [Mycena epipterygia]
MLRTFSSPGHCFRVADVQSKFPLYIQSDQSWSAGGVLESSSVSCSFPINSSATLFKLLTPKVNTQLTRRTMFPSSPPAESLPPPESVFSNLTMIADGASEIGNSSACHTDSLSDTAEPTLPITPRQRMKYFKATVVLPDNGAPLDSISGSGIQCPRWSEWATAQFLFDYLFMFITSSMTPELFIQRHREEYMDALFKLSLIVDSLGKMADGSPPLSLFQSLYHLRRVFPSGLLAAEDFRGGPGTTLLVRMFALGITVANQAIYEQRNLNLDWQNMCDIPDSYVDDLETTALSAFNSDVFDLSQNRTMYLDWLGHLGYHAEFYHFRTSQTYLRSSANLIAFVHAQAFSLPYANRRTHTHSIHLQSVDNLSLMLCWGTGLSPLRPTTTHFNRLTHNRISPSGILHNITQSHTLRPTAADVLAALAEECVSRLLYPLSLRATRPNYFSS